MLSVNTAVGRRWQVNLERDPHITLVVVNPENDQNLVEVRGTATARPGDGADRPQTASPTSTSAPTTLVSNKYIGTDYPWLAPGEQRITYVITPDRVRVQNPA